ncbi:MAG: hypothetical protein PHU23_00395 [Dehalococcoidales bacterium]|nr:hypothetical protein [Dehalococcoidales bacterium]
MLLTRKELYKIIRDWRIGPIPREWEKESLDLYWHELVTGEGQTVEYSEQDIVEGLRRALPHPKIIQYIILSNLWGAVQTYFLYSII